MTPGIAAGRPRRGRRISRHHMLTPNEPLKITAKYEL
jgi:hypothetical protein